MYGKGIISTWEEKDELLINSVDMIRHLLKGNKFKLLPPTTFKNKI